MAFPIDQYDVVLVYPPAEVILELYDLPDFPAIGIAYVGSYLEKHRGITPALIDARMSRLTLAETVEKIVSLNPKVVGISAMTHQVTVAARVMAGVKERMPDVVGVLGGFHASTLPERSLSEFPCFDFIAVGESEVSFSELVDASLSGRDTSSISGIWSRTDSNVKDMGRGEIPPTLDELGEPGWHLFDADDMTRYLGTLPVMGLRGCPFSCTFCSRPYGKKVRKRTPALIAAEIARNVEQFGVKKIHFFDETFSVDNKQTLALCEDLIARGLNKQISWTAMVHANTIDLGLAKTMKEAGCSFVGFGVESGDERIIKQMNKGVTKDGIIAARQVLKEARIKTTGYFMVGHPNETRLSIWRTIAFATRLNPDVAAIGIMVPYPGTEIWNLATQGKGGYVKLSGNWDDYNKQLGNAVELKNIPRWEIEIFQLLGYSLMYILNLRFMDLYRVAREHFALLCAMLVKIVLPSSVGKKVMMFRNDGARVYKERKGATWG